MSEPGGPSDVLVGLVRLRDHCTFAWEATEPGGRRTVRVRSNHCPQCVAELRELGYALLPDDKEED